MKTHVTINPSGEHLVVISGKFFADTLTISQSALQAMRDWVSECVWDEDCEVEEFTDVEIIRGVNRHYDGGLVQFQRDSGVTA